MGRSKDDERFSPENLSEKELLLAIAEAKQLYASLKKETKAQEANKNTTTRRKAA